MMLHQHVPCLTKKDLPTSHLTGEQTLRRTEPKTNQLQRRKGIRTSFLKETSGSNRMQHLRPLSFRQCFGIRKIPVSNFLSHTIPRHTFKTLWLSRVTNYPL